MATIIAPVYSKAWTNPRNGETRYYINNVWDIATSRSKVWICNGELHFAPEAGPSTRAKVSAAVEAYPMTATVTARRGGSLAADLAADFAGTMTRMMDEGWQ